MRALVRVAARTPVSLVRGDCLRRLAARTLVRGDRREPRRAGSSYVGTVVVSVLLLPSSQRGLTGVISIQRFSQR